MMENRKSLGFKIGLIVIFFSFTSLSSSQSTANCDLKFINHLVNAGNFEEALYLLDSTYCLPGQLNDSVSYFRGWSLYSLKRLSSSSESLLKVTPASEFYFKSHFFAGYNFTHIQSYGKALETFSKIDVHTEKQISLRNYELAGVYLLQGNYSKYEDSFAKINRSFYEITESSDNLQKIYTDMKIHKKKYPVLAGVLSGIIPGSGKFYSGKRGEAISVFIATTGLGFVTIENFRKNGLNNIKTIAFGTAFAFSYVANIYGAVISVNILETEYRDNVKNSILFNLHIPLRNTFDK